MADLPLGMRDIDVTVASPARIYDALLGGKDNFDVDRKVADQLLAVAPDTEQGVRENRAFLGRAVRYLSIEHKIRHFLDIGSGLPTQENVHQVAQSIDPTSRVVYVDNDPMATVHAKALMAGGDGVEAINADLRDPDELLARPEVRALVDLAEPMALLLIAILHFLSDDDRPYQKVATLVDALPPGSFVAISHGWRPDGSVPEYAEISAEVGRRYQASSALSVRSKEEIMAFFDGTDLVAPGLVWTHEWRPDRPLPADHDKPIGFYAGMGRVQA